MRKLRDRRKRIKRKSEDEIKADIRMISGCEDEQTSADVSDVENFKLPDPAGRAGGACTSALLKVLYFDEREDDVQLSIGQVLFLMKGVLKEQEMDQIPQLTASHKIDVNDPFDLVPREATGTRRAVMIGINYVGQDGELSGCHNDVKNMKEYIMDVHGFEEDNIVVLMDDGEHPEPTRENIMNAYQKIVEESEPGDAVFCHYSGHGASIEDDDTGEEADGYDETLVPLDYEEADMIRDDDLFETLVKPMKEGVFCVFVMDCCHSGTVLDLPYIYKADGNHHGMHENK